MVRHATAEPSAASDHERELTDRGRDDATAAGAWLALQGLVPDRALVSDAARTRDTWEALCKGAGWALDATLDAGLYAAGPETALDLLRATPEEARTLLVVGHNPTIAYLAQLLDGGDGDPDAGNAMAHGFPAGALAVLEHDGAWTELEMGCTRVVAFHVAGG